MSFNQLSPLVPSVYLAPLAYGANYDWGTLNATEQASEAYDLLPVSGRGSDPPRTFANRVGQPYPLPARPEVHILLASMEEFTEDTGVVDSHVAYGTILHPRGFNIVLATQANKDVVDIDLGFQLTEIADKHGIEVSDMSSFDDAGQQIPLEEARSLIVRRQIVTTIAGQLAASIASALPTWERNEYNTAFLKRVKRAGITAWSVLAITGLEAQLLNEPFIVVPGLVVSGAFGARTYSLFKKDLSGSLQRETHWQGRAQELGRLVALSTMETFIGPPPSASDARGG